MRWVGIDEAGYGPNLGPLVMTAVVAEGPDGAPPDLWADLAPTVSRAGGPAGRLWVDDSKRIYQAGRRRDRLDAGGLAAIGATGRPRPRTLGGLLGALGAGTLDEAELTPWLGEIDPEIPEGPAGDPLAGARWRVVDVRAVVVGPAAFNRGLGALGSKALVHFAAFARLLDHVRSTTPPGQAVAIRSDKHGGRHFYGALLAGAFPGARVEPGPEGPDLSRYAIRGPGLALTLSLVPRADAGDGLVALASMVSKATRERWMDAFNAYWVARIPGLRPTAGYPVDAARFRGAIEADCAAMGREPADWWRSK